MRRSRWSRAFRPALGLIRVEPRSSGFALCRRLQTEDRAARFPIILLSSRADEAHRIEAFESGADDYVSLPFSLPELLLRIRVRLSESAHASRRSGRVHRAGELEIHP